MAFDQNIDARTLPEGESTLADQAHNKPIEELVTKGILGLAAYLILLGRVSWVVVRSVSSDGQERWLALLIGSAMAAYFAQNLFLFDTPGTFLQFVLLLGWAAWKDSTYATTEAAGVARGADASGRTAWASLQHWLERRGVSSNMTSYVAIGLVTWTTLFSLVLFNLLPYRAGQTFPLQATSVGGFLSRAQASTQMFSPLATLPRIILFNTLTSHWESLSEEEAGRVISLVRDEERAAILSEPQNMRVFQALAELYQVAAVTAPQYTETARIYTDRSAELGPQVTGVYLLLVRQELLEGNYQEALDLIVELDHGLPSKVHWPLMGMRDVANRALKS